MESLDWRKIYDCKITCENVEDTFAKALEAGYNYFCHNNKIYFINRWTDKGDNYFVIGCILIK